MLGLTFEKLLIIGVLAAFLIGPERLPVFAEGLGRFIRSAKRLATDGRERVRSELGADEDLDWRSLDPRQFDPRRIIREALAEPEYITPPPPVPPPEDATEPDTPEDATLHAAETRPR